MPHHITLTIVLTAMLAAPVLGDRDATITVHPEAVVGKVNPLVFGNNQIAYQDGGEQYANRGSGIWDPGKRAPVPEYVALSKLAGITVQRWPGGCAAHNYNWKLTVGPLAERPNMQFGLPEYLTFCEATQAVPLLTVAVYWGDERDGADLVEYLNARSDGANPNGGKDWAAVRAWLMTGPSPTANNLTDREAITIREASVELRDGAYPLNMPACSMAAVEIAPL